MALRYVHGSSLVKIRLLKVRAVLLRTKRSAMACVTCDSATACQVRKDIFDHHFGHTLLLTAAPFIVLMIAAALVYFAFPVPQRLEQ